MTQITNNVPVSPAHKRDNGTIPLDIHTSKGEGREPMLAIPNIEDPGPMGDKVSEGIPSGNWMATRWTNSEENLRAI